ncbi:carotenoid oxygenase [Gonapodya prolifera JEL478]|uniref:Carotenoid oxygenase n=1 Tax=Gonapodya prolifera (strain JEL478) TaxID=1344416 RepID=A0A139AG96_GONPJ|nr:carotenoid oxygenase [Gonapodya prolifera JEL478]|eukprot:KXS15831.1 carotenoid oxygenase [Gonapodya prolifera JEL478]
MLGAAVRAVERMESGARIEEDDHEELKSVPVRHEEHERAPVVVEGQVPESFIGGEYIRNGFVVQDESAHVYEGMSIHWFDGNGQLHAVHFNEKEGPVTTKLKLEKLLKFPSSTSIAEFLEPISMSMVQNTLRPHLCRPGKCPSLNVAHRIQMARTAALYQLVRNAPGGETGKRNTANTAMVYYDGRFLALMEGGPPTTSCISLPNLETAGVYNYAGTVPRFTAHPKVDPVTGEMFFYETPKPHIMYYSVNSSGDLTTPRGIPVLLREPIMMHNLFVTENYAVVYDHPLVFSIPGAKPGPRPTHILSWRPELGTRIGVFPRNLGTGHTEKDIKWFDVETSVVIHTAARVLDSTLRADFPVVNTKYTCKRTRYISRDSLRKTTRRSLAVSSSTISARVSSHAVSDLLSGTPPGRKVISFPKNTYGGEAVFVPRDPNSTVRSDEVEYDGFLVVIVRDEARESSELHVYDARTMNERPVARLSIPHRVPYGFHGLWVTPEQIARQKVTDPSKAKEAGTDPIPEIGFLEGTAAKLVGTVASML